MMTDSFTLPILSLSDIAADECLVRHLPEQGQPALPRIDWIERHGRALHPSPLGADGDVLALNLARGCSHRCGFCAASAYASHPGDGVLQVYSDTPRLVEDELSGRRRLPRAVFISPSTDPFPPSSEVQAETVRVVHVLARHGVEAWLMTRGYIRPFALRTLEGHAKTVKVLVSLMTLDRNLQRILEPGTASPRLRLRQIARLRKTGIRVQVALDPLIPGLTDTRANVEPLLGALAELGVKQVTAGYLFLRSGIRENLQAVLQPNGWDELVLEAYAGGPMLAAEGIAPARYLPKARRQRGYAALMALASRHGIAVNVSGLSNPDFAPAKPAPARRILSLHASGHAWPA